MTTPDKSKEAPERIGIISDGLGRWALAHKDEADAAIHYAPLDLLTEARDKALEEAAQAAHDAVKHPSAYACVAAIRAMKGKP